MFQSRLTFDVELAAKHHLCDVVGWLELDREPLLWVFDSFGNGQGLATLNNDSRKMGFD
jgi:hypothetical protein